MSTQPKWIVVALAALALGAGCSKEDKGSQIGGTGASGNGDGGDNTGGTGGGFVIGDGSVTRFDDSSPPDGSCGQSVVDAQPKQVNILLVIDQSGSMVAPLGAADRWTAMEGALTTALQETKESIDFGLDLFPSEGCNVPSTPALSVPVEDGVTGVPKILDALTAAGPVSQGGTPTAAALGRALAYFTAGPGATLEGDRFVLLATDGGPNCNAGHGACPAASCVVNMEPGGCPVAPANCCAGDPSNCLDDSETTAQLVDLATEGVSTFVVGLPGTGAFADALNAFAVAGGQARAGATKYYAVTNAAELTDTFRSITQGLVKSCELQLTSDPPRRDLLNVEIDGERIPQAGADGWDLDQTTSPPTVRLKGQTCATIESTGAEHVAIIFGCPTLR